MTAERYYVKRPTGKVFGPFDKNAIQLMLKSNKLGFDAQVSQDKESWQPLSAIPEFAQITGAAGGGGADLPRLAGPSDLPRAVGGGGGADLPRPVGAGADLPRPVGGGADLPRPVGAGADLPRPAGPPDLPRPAGGSDLPRPAGSQLPRPSSPPNLPQSAGAPSLPMSSGPQVSEMTEDDLFGGAMSMTDDDEDLFGGPATTHDPEEDLFGGPAPSVGMDQDDLFGSPAPQRPQIEEDDLFGGPSPSIDVEEDDLFGGPPPSSGGGMEEDSLFGNASRGGPQLEEDSLFGGSDDGGLDEDSLFGSPTGGNLDEDSLFNDDYNSGGGDDDFLGGDQGFSFLDDGPSMGGGAKPPSSNWEDDLLQGNSAGGGVGGEESNWEDDLLTGNAPPPTGDFNSGSSRKSINLDNAPPAQPANMQAPGPAHDPFRPASTGFKEGAPPPTASATAAQVDKEAAADEDKKRGKMAMIGLPIIAILILGAVGLGAYRFFADNGNGEVKEVKKKAEFKLEYKDLYTANNGLLRDFLTRSKSAKQTPELEGKLLLAEALLISQYKDEDILKSATARSKKLASGKSDAASLGRGAFLVAKGDAKEGSAILESLADKGGDVGMFANLFLGIADFNQLPDDTLAALEQEEKDAAKAAAEKKAAEEAKKAEEEAANKKGKKKKSKKEEAEPAEGEEVAEEKPEEPAQPAGDTTALAEAAAARFAAAAKVDETLPLYWNGRLEERTGDMDKAIEHYRASIKSGEDFVPSHVALGRVYYHKSELNNASKYLERVNTDLTALAHNKDKAETLHYLGSVQASRTQDDLAIDSFTKALTADPSRKDTLRALAEAYKRAEKHKEALNFFRTNEALGQSDPDVMLGIVEAHTGLKEYGSAITQLEVAEKKFPTDARFPLSLGELNEQRGSFFEAQKAYERAVEIDPALLMAHAKLAQLAWKTDKDIERGEKHIKAIVERPEQITSQVASEVAAFYQIAGNPELARQWYESSIQQDPNYWGARLSLSQLLLEQGDTKKALSILERSREEGVQDIRLSASLADAYRQSKLYDKALDEINKVIEKVPKKQTQARARYIFIHGRINFDRGNYETALEDFNQAYTLNTRFHDAYFYVGRTKLAQDDISTALKIFRHVLDYQPGNGEYRFFMGQVLEQEQRLSQALEEYRKVTEVDPGYGVRNPRVYISRGRLLSRLGYSNDGKKDIQRALELAPEMEEALIAMGEADYRDKEYDKAIKNFTKALNKNPKYPNAQYELGMSYVYTDRNTDGAQHLQLAIKYGYEDPDVYRTLGYLYKQLGKKALAIKAFEEFLQLSLTKEVPLGTTKEVRRQLNDLKGGR